MRFSGSIYDAMRQPNVFKDLAALFGENREEMKKAILAQIRFDDILCNDSIYHTGEKHCIVASLTDMVDGRLMTLLRPADLKGVQWELRCRGSLAKNPREAVSELVRFYAQEENGDGKLLFFAAAPDGLEQTTVAVNVKEMKGLDIKCFKDLDKVLVKAGCSKEYREELLPHLNAVDESVKAGDIPLRAFEKPASAVPELERCLANMNDLDINDIGRNLFRHALESLRLRNGSRDACIAVLQKAMADSDPTIAAQASLVNEYFCHFTFRAIALSNEARPEHSSRVGKHDKCASPKKYLDRLKIHHTIDLDARIISGLGDLSGSEYFEIKSEIISDVRLGIGKFKKTGDLAHLSKSFDKLASRISKNTRLLAPSGRTSYAFFCGLLSASWLAITSIT